MTESNDEKITTTKTIEHPLEETFDIKPGTTLVERQETIPSTLVDDPDYDDKDDEIESQLQNIYQTSMDAYDMQSDLVETVDGKYAARNAEVAVQFLNTALNAVREKSNLKQHKDKISVNKNNADSPKTVNNNLIMADRNEILRALNGRKKNNDTKEND